MLQRSHLSCSHDARTFPRSTAGLTGPQQERAGAEEGPSCCESACAQSIARAGCPASLTALPPTHQAGLPPRSSSPGLTTEPVFRKDEAPLAEAPHLLRGDPLSVLPHA